MQEKSNILPTTDRCSNDFSNVFGTINNNPSDDFSQRNLNNLNKDNYNLFVHNQNVCENNIQKKSYNIDEIKKLILKIPSIILDNCVSEISLYVKLENYFMQMNNEFKTDFVNFLACSVNNNALIKTSSFNCFLQLLEFLMSLLIFVMINQLINFS